jgi:phosphoserine phosphatase RsbU/P
MQSAGDGEVPTREQLVDHAVERFQQGFTIEPVLEQYARLRERLVRDVTEAAERTRIHALIDQAMIAAAKHYVAQREQLRDRLMGVVAHDLRTPLACITMATEMLGADERTPHERSLLELVADASDRMQRMVGDVLSWARGMDEPSFVAKPRQDDLDTILRTAIRETRTAYGEQAISYETVGNLHGEFDHDRVHQAVTNLLRNAIEHGAGVAYVKAIEATDGQTITLVVRNQGALRSPNSSDVMEPFQRRKRSPSARGLGLYIVDQITQTHGATLDITSTYQETIVTIVWPTRRGG